MYMINVAPNIAINSNQIIGQPEEKIFLMISDSIIFRLECHMILHGLKSFHTVNLLDCIMLAYGDPGYRLGAPFLLLCGDSLNAESLLKYHTKIKQIFTISNS